MGALFFMCKKISLMGLYIQYKIYNNIDVILF